VCTLLHKVVKNLTSFHGALKNRRMQFSRVLYRDVLASNGIRSTVALQSLHRNVLAHTLQLLCNDVFVVLLS